MTPTVATWVSRALRFAIRIDSVPPKSERPIRLYWLLASVCQTKPPIDGLPQLSRQSRSRHTSARHKSLISVVSQSRRRLTVAFLLFTSLFLALGSGMPIFCDGRDGARRTRPQPGRSLPPTVPHPGLLVGELHRTNRLE